MNRLHVLLLAAVHRCVPVVAFLCAVAIVNVRIICTSDASDGIGAVEFFKLFSQLEPFSVGSSALKIDWQGA